MKNLLSSLFLLISIIIQAQNELYFEELEIHNNKHLLSNIELKPIDKNYPLSNLFDGNFKTCYIIAKANELRTVWIKPPEKEKLIINIFSGYGKSKALYYQNARVKKIHISLYYGFLPEAHCSENAFMYQITNLHKDYYINLKDTFGLQSFSIPIKANELENIKKRALKAYRQTNFPKAVQQGLFINLSVVEIYKGTKYDDVCISEIFFNKTYITSYPKTNYKIDTVFTNKEENALFIKTDKDKNILVYQDKASVLQILEVSRNKEWAILLLLPIKNSGRVETKYLIIDLFNKKIINNDLESRYNDFSSVTDFYFKQISGRLFLNYFIQNDLHGFIELKHK